MKRSIEKFNSISEFHRSRGLPQPEHPLVSLVDYGLLDHAAEHQRRWTQNYYSVALKSNVVGKFRYGQQEYDFDEGLMTFFAPNQVLYVEVDPDQLVKKPTGWILFFHPDFLLNTNLATKIRQYDFFGYALNEALFLSEKEEAIIENIFKNIRQEYQSNIDAFSQNIIIAQIELLLNYSERFYKRQFITRKVTNNNVLAELEKSLTDHFRNEDLRSTGLPTVQNISEKLNLSQNYLSSLLKDLTGLTTQQHIHEKLIQIAKEKLSVTELTVSEIAFELGFEHPQSFSKLFKSKTNQTPMEFRHSFN